MVASWQEVALFRAGIYRFLGHCLLEPFQADRVPLLQPEFWRDFPLAPANDVMGDALDRLVNITSNLRSMPGEAALERVQTEYTDLFLGADEPKAPPWESLYRTPERLLFGPPAFQVREAMARFGVAAAAKYRQPEDHLGLELMLLAAASEAASLREEAGWRDSARLQAEFIAAHPLGWIGDLEKDAAAHGAVGFYAALLGLTRGVLQWDSELLEEYLSA
ncbi:molecular chaperone [Anaeroselena agilis]|uniref:Molecular chaperone TorD family protein n=1 Tax=Anaeroselena agilis TaxID=3063788 RepID=A0ABU3P200_9FIRM|nr:molecular chaperone TorD family protein [Selenomonadales bacterium 4137-cl]